MEATAAINKPMQPIIKEMEEYLQNLPSNCDSSESDSDSEDEERSGVP